MRRQIYAFERDPYLRELAVQVIREGRDGDRRWAVLDDTILYPEGGGQPADHGRLAEVPVVDVRQDGDEVRHFLERRVATGPARLVLDWSRRYDHMQQHTAQHLLSSLALRRFGWATCSFHIGAETSDIELDREPLSSAEIEALEDAVAAVIGEARAITTRRVDTATYSRLEVRSRGLPADHRGSIRLVEIEGVDRNTCGGTHVRNSAEVGLVKIVDVESLRGGCRLRWVAGGRLLRRLAAHESRSAELRRLLDTGDEELAAATRLKLEQLAGERRERRLIEARLAEAIAERLLAGDDRTVAAHLEGPEAPLLRGVAEQLAARSGLRAALVTAAAADQLRFAVVVGEELGVDLRAVGGEIAALLGGRGGGSGRIYQGKAGSLDGRQAALARLAELVAEGG